MRAGLMLMVNSLHARNLLHGITLERMLNELVEHLGWNKMAEEVRIACFTNDPSVSSSLKFLRKTPWARKKVERLYLDYRTDWAGGEVDLE